MKTKAQYINEARALLGEKYATEMFDDSFLITQGNNAKTIINYYKGGKWDWAAEELIVPITTAISEYTLPADYLADMIISYGDTKENATVLTYVVPGNYGDKASTYNSFTIKANKLKFKELTSGNLYLEYYKRLPDMTTASSSGFTEMPPELDEAIVSYMVGMGFKKKRQFASGADYLGVADTRLSKRYPGSFWNTLMEYSANHLMGHTKTNTSKRPNPVYC